MRLRHHYTMSIPPDCNWHLSLQLGEAVYTPSISLLCVTIPVLVSEFGINFSGPPVHGHMYVAYRSLVSARARDMAYVIPEPLSQACM